MTLTLTVFPSMVLKCNDQHETTFSAYNRTHLRLKCRVITSDHLMDEVSCTLELFRKRLRHVMACEKCFIS